MSVSLSPPMFLQFFVPGTNAPAVGYQLFTYIANTSTKQATWTDSTQISQNANPVIADANGVMIVWLDPTLTYKFVLAAKGDTDPPTSPLYSVNAISGNVTLAVLTQSLLGSILYAQTSAEIAAGVTPTNYGYAPGVVDRYGTNTSPGTTDMSAAVQAAVACNAKVTCISGVTYLVAGVNITQSVEIDGNNATFLCKVSGGQYSQNMFTDTASVGFFSINNLTINGGCSAEGSQSSAWNISIIQLTQTIRALFENVTQYGYAASAFGTSGAVTTQFFQTFSIYNASKVDFVGCNIGNNYFPGPQVYFGPTSDGVCTVERCKFENTAGNTAFQTFLEIDGGNCKIVNNLFHNGRSDSWLNINVPQSATVSGNSFIRDDGSFDTSIAVNVGQSLFPYNTNVTVERNYFQGVGQAISHGPGQNVVIRDNIIKHAQLTAIFVQANSASGFATYNSLFPAYAAGAYQQSQNLTITGNKIYGVANGSNSVGIFVSDDAAGGSYGWQNVSITGNEIQCDPASSYSLWMIGYAIRVRDVAHCIIADNKQLNYGAYGIYSDGTVNDLIVRANTFIPINYLSGAAQSLDDIYFASYAPTSVVVEKNNFTAYPPGPGTYNVHFAGGDPNGCLIQDNVGMKQSFPVYVASSTTNFVIRNTRGLRVSGAPSSGNWAIGDVVYAIPANTAAVEYDCTAAGSFATLSGVTVTYVNGNTYCTQTAGTTLAGGMRISIANGAGGGSPLIACVLFVSGTTAFLDNTFGATEAAGQACTIVNPTFHAAAAYTT